MPKMDVPAESLMSTRPPVAVVVAVPLISANVAMADAVYERDERMRMRMAAMLALIPESEMEVADPAVRVTVLVRKRFCM